MTDDSAPIVIDTGTYRIKGGFAGDDGPICVDNNVVGYPIRHPLDIQPHHAICGLSALNCKGRRNFVYPMKGGLIQDIDAMIEMWSSVRDELRRPGGPENNFKDASIMLSEKFFNPESLTKRTFEVFFEHFNASSFSVVNDAVCACFSYGRTTGVVLDVGHDVTCCTPVYEGTVLCHGASFVPRGGMHVVNEIAKLLPRTEYSFHNAQWFIEKDNVACVSVPGGISPQLLPCELPDGNEVRFTPEQRIQCTEVLFDDGMASRMVHDCFPRDGGDVIFCGGGSMFRGYSERIMSEVTKQCPGRMLRPQVAPERQYSVFIGMSILGSLGKYVWPTKQYYEEHGAEACHTGWFAQSI